MRRFVEGDSIVLATHNPGKITELRAALERRGLTVLEARALGLEAPAETADDFALNAIIKAREAAELSGLPALADDSGFAVASLGGAPGILSARWAAGGDYASAMTRIFDAANALPDRRASFVCVLAVAWPGGEAAPFEGRIEGEWVWPPRGESGFGYDPMFLPGGGVSTFAEMTNEAKASISHRARAFETFARMCLP